MKLACLLLLAFLVLLSGCTAPEQNRTAIVGARMPGPDGRTIERSIVIVEDGRIRAAGPQAMTPMPKDAEVVDAYGGEIKPGNGKPLAPGAPADFALVKDGRTRVMKDGQWQ